MTLDEFEALRLADLRGLYQEEACARMQVSRATFGNILGRARNKIAAAVIEGKAIRIKGGVYRMRNRNRLRRRERCQGACDHAENSAAAGAAVDNAQGRRANWNQDKGIGGGRRRFKRRGD